MQHRFTNWAFKVIAGSVRATVVHALVFSLVLPAGPAFSAAAGPKPTGGPVSIGGLMKLNGFKNLVMTIAMVNQAMRIAADNPMDEWRRTNVRIAMSMMPGAIAGMAQEFMKGKLGNDDLPIVQGILGGFVDKNAGAAYEKFMKDPSARNIPKLGAGFPNVTPPPVPKAAAPALASYSKGQPSSGGAVVGAVGKVEVDRMPTKEMVSLTQRRDAKPEGLSAAKTQSTTYDDSVAKASDVSSGGAQVGVSSKVAVDAAPQGFSNGTDSYRGTVGNTPARDVGNVGSAPSNNGQASSAPRNGALPYVGSETVLRASRELSSIEQSSRSSETRLSIVRGANTKKDEAQDEEFFDNVGKPTKKPAPRKTLQRRPTTRPTSSLGPTKFFKFLALGFETLLPQAHAECEEEGGRQGADAGAILMGLAAIMAAVAPMVVASIQANADKDIAKTNANAQIKMTEITAETQKQANEIAQNVALTQSATAQGVAAMNNQGVTDRLQMQLAELSSARNDARQAEEERRRLDQEYNAQRLALAEKQSQQNLDLAKETLAAQLSEAGLRSGFSSSTNTGLETTKTASGLATTNANPLTNGSRLGGAGNNPISTAPTGGSSGLALRAGSSSSTGLPSRTGSTATAAKTSATFDDKAPAIGAGSTSTVLASSGSGSTSLNLSSRGALDNEGENDRYATTGVNPEMVTVCGKLTDAAAKKKCLDDARKGTAGATRGARPKTAPTRLISGLQASTNGRGGMAQRLNQLVASTPTNSNVMGSGRGAIATTESPSEMRAFVKPQSSFGGFLESQKDKGAEKSFATYQQTAGVPHRSLTSAKEGPSISGGHKATSGSGILQLTH